LKDLTVFVLTTGEESLSECLRAIERQNVDKDGRFTVEIIKDVYPVHEAFNEMHIRAKTPYFIQVDADVILDDGAIETLYKAAKYSSPLVCAAYGQLYEEGFGPGGSVRCWKRSIFNLFKFRDVRTTDRDFYKRAILLGFHRKDCKKTIGIHRPRQSDFLDYWKTKGDIEKWQFLGRPFGMYAEALYKKLIESPKKNRYKILGFSIGVLTSKKRINRSKDTFVEMGRIGSIFKSLGKEFNTFSLGNEANLSRIGDIASKTYLSFEKTKKKDSVRAIFKEIFKSDLDNRKALEMYERIKY